MGLFARVVSMRARAATSDVPRSGAGRFRRSASLGTTTALVAAGLFGVTLVTASQAQAVPGPIASRTPAGVTSDALPTAQINGVAWTQQVAGNTVFVGGKFTSARAAGNAAGVGEQSRNNLMSYTLSTGVMTSWAPNVNGQIISSALSPSGAVLYIGGDFTTVNGVNASHIAAFDTGSGALITSFAARTDAQVKAITATSTTVYAGGSFSTGNGVARGRLAAFATTNGALQPWNPGADVTVYSMTMNPSNSLVIVGGAFAQLAGQSAKGLGAVDPSTGARVYWAATDTVTAWGQNNAGPGTGAAIYSLSRDGTNVYGTGYNYYGYGNLEGTFSANGDTGAVTWVEDCHGDTYSVFAGAGAVYTVGHRHYCGNIGGFPQTSPWTFHHLLAYTTQTTGTINHDSLGYFDWYGTPSPSMVNWFPDFTTGSITGLSQAAWSVTGNSQYVVAGGEFPTVNGTAQQGLVRFGVPSVAPNKQGPRQGTSTWTPAVRALSSTSALVSFQTNWDRDDQDLTYQVIRNGKVVYTAAATSQFWNRPSVSWKDDTVTGGSTYSYYIKALDANNNAQFSSTVTLTVPTNLTLSQYATDVYTDGAASYWRLDETSGSTAYDNAGTNNMAITGAVTQGASGAVLGDANTADSFDGSTGLAATTTAQPGPNVFTQEFWFKTTTTVGGKMVGFGDRNTGRSGSYDRHTYMNPNGTVTFGVYNSASYTITTPTPYNDGQWHYAAGTLSSTGMAFYVDGKRIGTNGGTTVGQSYAGYWRVGGDSPWNGNAYFNGSIDEVAIYSTPLSLTQVRQHYADSGRTLGGGTAPTDTYGRTVYTDQPDYYYRLDDASGPAAADFSGNSYNGAYSGGETFQAASTVAGATGSAVTFNGSDGTLGSAGPISGPSVYSEEAWFKTTSTGGGKLVGFGDRQSGNSGNYDRHIFMLNSGQLTFGTWTGSANLATSPGSYNDGSWHYLVATQGSDGMKLYVDNQLVATNGQTSQQSYSGYWRVGGDTSWAANNYFAGTIDEAAFYSTVLTPAQIAAHYNAASAVNHAPTAAFTSTAADLHIDMDGSTSTDSDGTVASYSWDFGDTTSASGATTSHTYGAPGTYTVTLTVTDSGGATNSVSHTVTATAPNQPPVAGFSSAASGLTATLDSSTSSDPDGTIAGYAWNFGDGTTDTTASPSHAYAAGGTFSVTLTVTDNRGATNTISHPVTVVAPNQAPAAAFTATANNLVATFDSSTSSDPDGTVAGYTWDFGDGASASTASPSHTYGAAGTYQVVLTVTDNVGATNSVSRPITVAAANQPPTAAFSATSNGLVAAFSSTGTSDPDGSIVGYAWDFGDSGTATTAAPNHTYGVGGSFLVTLTVTDNNGASNSVNHVVTVAPSPDVAVDAFGRTTTGGWGTATTGGPWTRTSGAASAHSVNGSAAQMTMATGGTVAEYLNAVSQQNVAGTVDFSLSGAPTGGGIYTYVALRHTAQGEYRIRLRLQPTSTVLSLDKVIGGVETAVVSATLPGVVYNAGDVVRLKFDVTGNGTSTVLSAKSWKVGATEPAAWQATTNEATAVLQVAGSIGVIGYLSGVAGTVGPVTLGVDNLAVTQH